MLGNYLFVVTSTIDDRHQIAVEQIEELLGDVVAAQRVLQWQVELVVELDALVAVVELVERTERLAALAEDVNGRVLLEQVDIELAPRVRLAVRHEPDAQFCFALGVVARHVTFGRFDLLRRLRRVGQDLHLAVRPVHVRVHAVRHGQIEEVVVVGQLVAGEAPLRRLVRHHDEQLVLAARRHVRVVAQRRPVEHDSVVLVGRVEQIRIVRGHARRHRTLGVDERLPAAAERKVRVIEDAVPEQDRLQDGAVLAASVDQGQLLVAVGPQPVRMLRHVPHAGDHHVVVFVELVRRRVAVARRRRRRQTGREQHQQWNDVQYDQHVAAPVRRWSRRFQYLTLSDAPHSPKLGGGKKSASERENSYYLTRNLVQNRFALEKKLAW